MDPILQKEIESLRHAKMTTLKTRYRELFGEESPSSNRAHLFRRLAWRFQAQALGDLSERARRRAAELADDAELRRRALRNFWHVLDAPKTGPHRDPRLPEPGTVLTRLYQQRLMEVKVLETGFEYNGQTYSSLSALAYQVSGTRWNGFLFFGLTPGKRHG